MNAFSTTKIGALIVAVSLSGLADDAAAQESPYLDFNHPSITVDLSVIDDSGYGPGAPGTSGAALNWAAQRKLQVSGAMAPASMLHVEPVGGKTAASARMAAAPSAAPKPVAAAPKKKKVIAKVEPVAPVAAPAPAPVVEKKPEIAATAPKKLEAPAPATSAPPPPTVAKAPKVTPSETAMPAAPKASETKKQATEQASVPDAGEDAELGLALQVVFANDATRLPADAKSKLKSLAQKVQSKDGLRLQLMAYAGGDKLSSSLARRLSLSRALSVRSFLIENGVRSTRIDVRALGNKTDKKPLNRVDLNITER